jgi:hypothetical protein
VEECKTLPSVVSSSGSRSAAFVTNFSSITSCLKRRKLNLKAKLESSSSCYSFERLPLYTQGRSSHLPIPTLRFSCYELAPLFAGAFNVGLIG